MRGRAVETIVLRLYHGNKAAQRQLPPSAYRQVLNILEPAAADGRLVSRSLSRTDDLVRMSKGISRCLRGKRSKARRVMIIELLDRDADVSAYDDLSSALHSALSAYRSQPPFCVCIAISNADTFKFSEFWKRKLEPLCVERGIGLVLLGCGREGNIEILSRGKTPRIRAIAEVQPCPVLEEPEKWRVAPRSAADIESQLDVLLGHFEFGENGAHHHIPVIASVAKLADDATFVRQLREEIGRSLGKPNYQVMPLGVPLGGIEKLSLAVVDGDVERLLRSDLSNLQRNSGVVFLGDLLSKVYSLEERCSEVKERGVDQIMIVGVGRYVDSPAVPNVKTLSFVDLNYRVARADDRDDCKFCKQELPVIKGEDYASYARQLGEFDPFTFWELVGENPDYYRAGHWPSDRTPNHYQFRIMVGPMLRRHCHGLSLRIRNRLEERGILSGWIDKIMCTEGEEAKTLALGVANVIGLSPSDVIAIPRRHFASIAGSDVSKELLQSLEKEYGKAELRHRNVIIVDQAAHHFKTLSALRALCEHLDSKILAFAVVVDRTEQAFELGDYLHDSYYVHLYSWSSPPRWPHECPCAGAEQ